MGDWIWREEIGVMEKKVTVDEAEEEAIEQGDAITHEEEDQSRDDDQEDEDKAVEEVPELPVVKDTHYW